MLKKKTYKKVRNANWKKPVATKTIVLNHLSLKENGYILVILSRACEREKLFVKHKSE